MQSACQEDKRLKGMSQMRDTLNTDSKTITSKVMVRALYLGMSSWETSHLMRVGWEAATGICSRILADTKVKSQLWIDVVRLSHARFEMMLPRGEAETTKEAERHDRWHLPCELVFSYFLLKDQNAFVAVTYWILLLCALIFTTAVIKPVIDSLC